MAYSGDKRAACRQLANHLNAQSVEQLRRKYALPEHFGENLLKCLPAGIETLKPSLYLLSKVTFHSDHNSLELFALWRRILKELDQSPFVEANFLKATSKVCSVADIPEVFKSSVAFEALYAVLISAIKQKQFLSERFLVKFNSVKKSLTDCELINLAETLLMNECCDWSKIILIYPSLLGVMLALNYREEFFISQVRVFCEHNEYFHQIVLELRNTWFPFV